MIAAASLGPPLHAGAAPLAGAIIASLLLGSIPAAYIAGKSVTASKTLWAPSQPTMSSNPPQKNITKPCRLR